MSLLQPDYLAQKIISLWKQLSNERDAWLARTLDVRKYINAPDTSFTEVGKLPWKNKTTIPKLTQIYDNLLAQYRHALFPSDDWFVFVGDTEKDNEKDEIIQKYLRQKLDQSDFIVEIGKILSDFIITGVCCGGVEFVKETSKSITGETITKYVGAKVFRVSPFDFVIEPRANSFDESIFIRRYLMPINKFYKLDTENSIFKYNKETIEKAKQIRGYTRTKEDFLKDVELLIDGFGSPEEYFNSGVVEVLEFWGDLYIAETGVYLENYTIAIVDRMYVLYAQENPMLNGKKPYAFSTWRPRTDNLYGQSPLEQLVGMQYRIDHLENLKADVFDLIAHPIVVITGNPVDEFEWRPGKIFYTGLEGKVEILKPDVTALMADTQIAQYMDLMELMAGTPRETMGFRTPGEKTAYEVDVLYQGAVKMFLDKMMYFENTFLKRILENFYIITLMNFDFKDFLRVFDNDTKKVQYIEIDKDKIVANGQFKPKGASHFERKRKLLQDLMTSVERLSSIPATSLHIDGKAVAKEVEKQLDYGGLNFVKDYQAIIDNVNARYVEYLQNLDIQQKEQMRQQIEQLGGLKQGLGMAGANKQQPNVNLDVLLGAQQEQEDNKEG